MVAAQTLDQLDLVFTVAWEDLIPQEFWQKGPKPKIKYVGYTKKNGSFIHQSTIYLQYADIPRADTAFKGANLRGYLLIQAESFRHESVFNQMELRVRGYDDSTMTRMIDANPGTPDHFIHRFFIDKESDQYIGEEYIDEIWIRTTPETSVYSAEQLAQWKRTMPDWWYTQMIEAQWVSREGRIYGDYHVLDKAPLSDEIIRFWVGIDPGTAGMGEKDQGKGNLALVWLGVREDGVYIVLSEKLLVFSSVKVLADVIKAENIRWGTKKYNGLIRDWGGGSGSVFASELPKYMDGGIWKPAQSQTKWGPVSAGCTLLQEHFKTRKLLVSPECVKIIADTGKYVAGKDGEPDKKVYDSHLLDALRYVWIRVSRMFMRSE